MPGNQYLPGERSASEPRWNGRRGRKGTAYTAGFSDLKALIRQLLWSQVSKGRSCRLKPVMRAGFLLPTRVVVPSSDFHTHVGHQGPACPSVGKMVEDMSWYQQLRIIGTSYFRTGGQGHGKAAKPRLVTCCHGSQDSANQTPLQVAARRGWVEVCCCIAYHVLHLDPDFRPLLPA